MKTNLIIIIALAMLTLAAISGQAAPIGTEFTYQGRLTDAAGPPSGSYDITFALHLAASGGTPTVTVTNLNTAVSNGLFTATVDFGGGIYNGNAYWLQLGVRTNGNITFTPLSPRQPLTPTPNASYASLAGNVPGGSITSAKLAVDSVTVSALQNNAVTAAKVAAGQLVKSVNGLRDDVLLSAGPNLTITPSGNTLTLAGSADWKLGGNPGTTPGTHFIGTADNHPLELKVNGTRALRLEPNTSGAPNVIGGSSNNFALLGVVGATIGGGGAASFSGASYSFTNKVTGNFGTVGGGGQNTSGGGDYATVGGGYGNTSSGGATVGGGSQNTSSGNGATVSGGQQNTSSGFAATVAGGYQNNAASPYSFAAGRQAKANHEGAFVWADSTFADFASTTNDQFSIRAHGGVRLSDDTPNLSFGSTPRQMLNLWGTRYGIGVQSYNLYFRTDDADGSGAFAWYRGGTHNNAAGNPGGGQTLMNLDATGLIVSNVKLAVNPNGGIELGPPTAPFAVPFIDFHHGVNAEQDFNVRLINDADHQLKLQGNFAAAGSVVVDQDGLNNGDVFSAGLTFGTSSGEGIASRRTPGDNRFGLDLYTGGLKRMSILNNNGNVGIGTISPSTKLEVNGTVTANSDVSEGFNVGGAAAGYALQDRVTGAAGRWVMFAANDTLAFWRGGNTQMLVDQSGNFTTAGSASVCALTIRGGCDLAEPFQMSGKNLPKGAVVVIDEANPGHLKLSESAYDTRVAGIISGANGVNPGISLHQEGVIEGGQNVALSGRVYVQADASTGAIKPGDLLTTSSTAGHAMKVAEHGKAQGAILGKAMTALAEGQGMVLVLVSLQ